MLLLQETKFGTANRYICEAIWGDTDMSWKAEPAVNKAGGLLCIWKIVYLTLRITLLAKDLLDFKVRGEGGLCHC